MCVNYEPKSVLAYCRVFVVPVVNDQNVESEGLSFDSSWELRMFLLSLINAHDLRKKKHLSSFYNFSLPSGDLKKNQPCEVLLIHTFND